LSKSRISCPGAAQHAIAGLLRDERDLVGMQPEIQRMDHRTGERNPEVRLEVLRVVPHQRRDAIVLVHTGSDEGARELPRATDQRAVGGARQAAIRPT
jgi:hypothetical protein